MKNIKLVCFDLDYTLIYEVHSVLYPCIVNGKQVEAYEIEKLEGQGVYDWIEADHYRALLLKGLHVDALDENFDNIIKPIKNIAQTIQQLHKKGIICGLITAGPIQVAKLAAKKWGFDFYHGSLYEIEDDLFTGKITEHIGDKGKVEYLKKYCENYRYKPEDCFAIGDGGSDIPMFNYCGGSLAINYGDSIIGKAQYYLKTDDLTDILVYLI